MNAPDSPSIAFVIPAYRSQESISGVLDEIFAEFPRAEVIVVVDGSPDRVADTVREYAQTESRPVECVELRQNRGQHYAILEGFKRVTAPFVATIDDDGQNPAAEYKKLLAALKEEDRDCMYGAFEVTRQGLFRRFLSHANKSLSAHFMGNSERIPLSNVRLLRSDLAHAVEDSPTPYPFIDALIFRATKHIGWRRVEQRSREEGRSSYSLWKLAGLAISHTTIFSTLPLAFIAGIAFLVATLLFGWAGYVFLVSLFQEGAPLGWPSMMLIVTVMFSMQFVFMGVLSIYIGRLYIGFNSKGTAYKRRETGPEQAP